MKNDCIEELKELGKRSIYNRNVKEEECTKKIGYKRKRHIINSYIMKAIISFHQ
jgi:hypothetical protein